MNENFKEIVEKFKKINEYGYIKAINNNLTNACGLTFEHLLNIKENNLLFPDYKGIEIKTTQRFSRYPITLLSLAFDGPNTFESNYLLEKYGKTNKDFNDMQELMINLKYKQKILYNNYLFELDMDNEKIFINIYSYNNVLLEKRAFIYFNSIEQRLKLKINNLVLVYASKKIINENLWFRYYGIKCLIYKQFNSFLELIKTDDCSISLILRHGKSKKYLGTNKNKNMVFAIKKDSLDKLFDEIYSYEN